MPKPKTVAQGHKKNFETLKQAFKDGNVALMDCTEKATGEHVAVICTVAFDINREEYCFTPFAKFFNGNPFEMLTPPMEKEAV